MVDLLHLVNSTAMMAMIALIYGIVQRRAWAKPLRHGLLGATFGLGAVFSMLQPLYDHAGTIADARTLFLGFAGAFLGPVGAIVALMVGAAGRLAISVNQSAVMGILAMALAGTFGLLWIPVRRWLDMNGVAGMLLLGSMISLSLVALFFVPLSPEVAARTGLITALAGYNLAGSLILGGLLHRERRIATREREALHSATTDPLTGLLNRRSFEERYRAADDQADSRGTSLLLVDLDHFKSINDTYGHSAGDEILRIAAQKLKAEVRDCDSVLRIGGEEFAVLLPNTPAADAERVGERLCLAMRLSCAIEGAGTISVTASIGGTWCQRKSADLARLSRAADEALYAAKRQGRNRAVFHRNALA